MRIDPNKFEAAANPPVSQFLPLGSTNLSNNPSTILYPFKFKLALLVADLIAVDAADAEIGGVGVGEIEAADG